MLRPRGRAAAQLRHRTGVGVLTFAAVALYVTYAVSRLSRFRAATYDLVIFDQAVRSYSRFEPGLAPVKGVHNDFGPDFSVLGDHFSPILAVLAPLYWLHDRPIMLVVAQAVLIGSAIPFVWVFANRLLGPVAAYLAAGAFALSWQIQSAIAFDFHEVAFAVPLVAIAMERFQAGRYWHVTIAAGVLLLVKEDMGFLVAGLGVLLMWRARRRLHGLALVVIGLAMVWLTTQVFMPLAGGRPGYYWQYEDLGGSPGEALVFMVTNPLETLALFVTPDTKLHTLLWLFVPLALCTLVSPYVLPALPLLAERLLASNPNWWTTWPHYNAFVVVLLFCAGIDGAARVARWVGRTSLRRRQVVHVGWAAFALAAALVSVGHFPFGNLTHGTWWPESQRQRAAATAVATIPDGATVEVLNNLGPALTGRCDVRLLDRTPRDAPWVITDTRIRSFPFRTLAEQRARLGVLEGDGYRRVWSGQGYVVLHRSGS